VFEGTTKMRIPVLLALAATAALLAGGATPARAFFYSLQIPVSLQCEVRSQLAEAQEDPAQAIAWAESLATVDPTSSYAKARVAVLREDAGDDAIALQWGEQALALDSLNVDAAMLVGRMHLRSGEAGLAVQVLTPPLRRVEAIPELYALRALANELDKHYDAAISDLRHTDVLLPDFAWIASGILSMALEDGRLEEAYSALQLALELKPDDRRNLGLGVTLAERLGKPKLEEDLLRQLASGPDAKTEDVAAYAAFLIRAGREREATKSMNEAGVAGLHTNDIRINTGNALLRSGDERAALAVVKPLGPMPEAISVRNRAHLALGEEKEALEGYRMLLPQRGLTREESLVVAYLEIRVGKRDRGIQTLEAVRTRPLDSPRQVLAASLCYSLLGHPDDALTVIRESVGRGLASPSMYQDLGSAATTMGDSLLAQWAWDRLRDLGRETSECLYFMGSAELAKGESAKATQTLARAIQLNPKNGKALCLLGTLQEKSGQLELARETLIEATRCPESATEANRALARVCRSLRLESEAREAEARARSGRPAPPTGLSLFQNR
jgi:tetratricopeptide (TPR) repeat protein